MFKRIRNMMRDDPHLSISWRDTFISISILSITATICITLNTFANEDTYQAMLFSVAVLLISRFTNGYLYGIVSSFLAVVCVNYIFTFPYFELNFTNPGYPLTFVCMLTTSIITSAMTTQFKKSQKIKAEINTEKIRSNLLRAVSHDLRTPLTSIIGSIQAIMDNKNTFTDEEEISLLAEAKEDAQWLIRMVENLLSITKISDGAAKINKSSELAEEVVGETVRKFTRRFPAVDVIVSLPDELLFVPMDPILIEQVLENLMENSVQHGVSTSKIELKVNKLGDFALFSIADNGIGIDTKYLKNIFKGKIIHDSNKEADSKKNMGIGLSVCLSIVKAHGGDMTANNTFGGGVTMQFTIPLEEEDFSEK